MKKLYILFVFLLQFKIANAQGKFGGGNGDGYASQSISNIVLPLQLLRFEASYKESRIVQLMWLTTNESNIASFEVQRSVNGTEWQTIASETSKGSNATENSYTTADNDPQQNISYYRLKILETGGRFTYSPVVTVKINKPLSFSIYPNPVKQVLFISTAQRNNTVSIADLTGKTIMQWSTVPTEINIGQLACGMYILRIGTEVRRLVKE